MKAISGIAIRVSGLRAAIGDVCTIHSQNGRETLPAEVVGFDGGEAVVLALGDQHGVAPWDLVRNDHRSLQVPVGPALLGRVLDALGRPIDGGPPLEAPTRSITATAPTPLERAPIHEPLVTGVAAIDGFATCGKGQRIGIFAGSGVGKSTLMGTIAKSGSAAVNVSAMIGERGREVGEFLTESLGREGMAKSVVIACTSDQAPMLRLKAPMVAVTIAEAFREQGQDVLFLMDSVTRFAMAAREVGLAAGEPPTLRGYPPSLFAKLPQLVERLGNDGRGSYRLDPNHPDKADALRGYLDGHIVLSRKLAERGRFPAIDVLASISRLMPKVTTKEHQQRVRKVREWMAHYEENRDLITVGAYKKGGDQLLDQAIARLPAIEELLFHGATPRPLAETQKRLQQLAGS